MDHFIDKELKDRGKIKDFFENASPGHWWPNIGHSHAKLGY
jgi:hypothetical protein